MSSAHRRSARATSGLLLVGSWLSCAIASADAGALFPSASARSLAEATRASAQLERSLALLPDVLAARVQLALPTPDAHPIDQAMPAPRMSVVLRLNGPGPSDEQVQQLATTAVRTALELPIVVVRGQQPTARAAHPGTTRVGPFEVSTSSAGPLKVTLATCLAANVFLATILLLRRRRRGPRNQQN